MGRILAIDYGKKRVGLAISDELGLLSRPFLTLRFSNQKELLEKLVDICEKNQVEKIVVGWPLTFRGEAGKQAKKVAFFVENLKKVVPCEIVLEDERLTTKMAQKIMIRQGVDVKKNKEILDQLAAKLILQSYLERTKK